jgi:hypothetical protein
MDTIKKTFLLILGALSITYSEISQAIEDATRYVEIQEDNARHKLDQQSKTQF